MKEKIINFLSIFFKCYRPKEITRNILSDIKKDIINVSDDDFPGLLHYDETIFVKNDKEKKIESNIAEGLVDWAVKNIIKVPFGVPGAELISLLIKTPESYTIKNVLDKLNQIEDELKDLINKVTEYHYEDAINDRNRYVREMENAQALYTSRLINADSDEEYKTILDEWATKTIGGNPSLNQFNNFIGAIMTNLNDSKTLYDVYDGYTYYTTPWENMGYRFREEVRSVDLAIILSQIRLAILYYTYTDTLKPTVKEEMIKNVQNSLQKYLIYYNAHKVIRHDDVAICQIPNAKLTIQKNMVIRTYYNMPWFPRFTPWRTDEQEPSTWLLTWGADCYDNRHRTFTTDEFNAIADYYGGQNITFNDILRQGGINVPNGKTKLVLYGEAYQRHDCDCDYFIDVENVCKSSENKSISRETIGSAYLERHGFLWLEQWFNRWASYDYSNVWIIPKINR